MLVESLAPNCLLLIYGWLAAYCLLPTTGYLLLTMAAYQSFHGDDGYWLTRRLMHQRRHGDRNRGDHYFHSSFADLVSEYAVSTQ